MCSQKSGEIQKLKRFEGLDVIPTAEMTAEDLQKLNELYPEVASSSGDAEASRIILPGKQGVLRAEDADPADLILDLEGLLGVEKYPRSADEIAYVLSRLDSAFDFDGDRFKVNPTDSMILRKENLFGNDGDLIPPISEKVARFRDVLTRKLLAARVPLTKKDSSAFTVATWNIRKFTGVAAERLAPGIEQVVDRMDFMGIQESTWAGQNKLVETFNLEQWSVQGNNRFQRCGAVWQPTRLKKIKWVHQIDDIKVIDGVPGMAPGLRPAQLITMMDQKSGFIFNVVIVHLKSMLGGRELTSKVRHHQLRKLAKALDKLKAEGKLYGPIVILGDFNCPIDRALEIWPLIEAGYWLVEPDNDNPTHTYSERFDCFLVKDFPEGVSLKLISPEYFLPLSQREWKKSDRGDYMVPVLTPDEQALNSGSDHGAQFLVVDPGERKFFPKRKTS